MSKINYLVAKYPPASGRFIDIDDVLLSLFADPDYHGDRRWPEAFGYAHRGTSLVVKDSFLAHAIEAPRGTGPVGGALTASSSQFSRMPPRSNPSERGGKPPGP